MILKYLILTSVLWAAEPPQTSSVDSTTVMPRAVTDSNGVIEAPKDDDLKQAEEWIDKREANADIKNEAKAESLTDAVSLTKDSTDVSTPKEENQIPVLSIKEEKKIAKQESPLKKAAFSMLIVLGMMTGGFIFFKKWAQKQNKNSKNNQIKILTQHFLGPRKSLAIIRVAGESMLIGITDSNITMIKSLALMDEEIPAEIPEQFSKSLDKAQTKMSKNDAEPEDEFALSRIKDFVSDRLKGMKEI